MTTFTLLFPLTYPSPPLPQDPLGIIVRAFVHPSNTQALLSAIAIRGGIIFNRGGYGRLHIGAEFKLGLKDVSEFEMQSKARKLSKAESHFQVSNVARECRYCAWSLA